EEAVGRLLGRLDSGRWFDDHAVAADMRREMVRLCSYYLLHAKQGAYPLDPVARFHLGNGARLEKLNWLGDISEMGMRRSVGLMVNYAYRLDDVERNHEAFARDGRVVAPRRFEVLARETLAASAEDAQPVAA